MLYIILCIPLYILNSFCDKSISVKNSTGIHAAYNLLKFLIGSLLLFPLFCLDPSRTHGIVILYGILCGFLYALSKMLILSGYEQTSIAFMTLCHAAGMLLPCIVGHFLWGETLSLLSLVGILLVVASIFLLKDSKKVEHRTNRKGIFFGVAVLFTSGGVMVLQKVMGMYHPDSGVDAYNFYSFLFAFLLLGIFAGKSTAFHMVSKKMVFSALGSAVSLCIISLVMTHLASSFPSVILFPLYNGSSILLVTLLSALRFHEHITPKKGIGMAVGLLGLYLINL